MTEPSVASLGVEHQFGRSRMWVACDLAKRGPACSRRACRRSPPAPGHGKNAADEASAYAFQVCWRRSGTHSGGVRPRSGPFMGALRAAVRTAKNADVRS
jgi:hypothetical protein